MKSKVIGSLIGAAIGDGFGYETEFLSYEEINKNELFTYGDFVLNN